MSSDRLPLEAARVVELGDGYRVLELTVAGRVARLDTGWKPALRDLGLVLLGEEVADLVPHRTYRDPASGTVTELPGATDDPRVFRLFTRFRDGRLEPGPAPIPD